MKKQENQMTASEAVDRLRKIYGTKDRPKGRPTGKPRLTLKMIMDETKVKTIPTVSLWISEGENHHEPQGAALENLIKFLKKAEDKKWLENFIQKKVKK